MRPIALFAVAASVLLCPTRRATAVPSACASQPPLRVRFFDVGQGLSALVTLPDRRTILIDTGTDQPKRYFDALKADLGGRPIDLVWITHQHVDHIGGADVLLKKVPVRAFAHNGRSPTVSWVAKARAAAQSKGVPIKVFGPGSHEAPLASTAATKITAIVPRAWPAACEHDENECSIGLRIDHCKTSFLFVGDAETAEEKLLDPRGTATVLQVGHHGSDTSSSDAFLARVKPKYAVVSAGKPGVGANMLYCHPRSTTMERLTRVLGGPGAKSVSAFDAAVTCNKSQPSNWKQVPVSDRLWITGRDGDVVLTTRGDGTVKREVVPQ